MSIAPKFLFVPVSSDEGIGEYMRSKIIADEIMRRWPAAQIDFVLNRYAPYSQQCPYRTHLVDDTPTKKVKEVNQLVTELQPDIVIFDAAGRKAQLKHANRQGAKVIFISQHRRKRARGMKVERALVTDSHWVVQPEFVIGDLTAFEKFKLRMIDRPQPIYTGSVFTEPDPQQQQALLKHYQLQANDYVLFSAGSGGHKINGSLAADLWAKTAQTTYQQLGIACVVVFGPNYPKPLPTIPGVIAIAELDSQAFIHLLGGAKAALLSGGDTLLQAIALKTPTLAAAVSKDQPSRIKKCQQAGVIVTADNNHPAMSLALSELLQPKRLAELKQHLDDASLTNGLTICLAEVERLLNCD
ncbi:hypothetical protein FLM48_22065 [Shewanella sp. Scap07]|uniref:glycosyltransferase family 9 protein n=1 Tax=Shewanella sp. Scap07 TaxID=2589987 RepID=UPI0015C01490|nr:hypothetical protein [Shewanella sp. Scap07]QLE87522.1 hypothetical protein FLM48_22065 [Shewanella sp. Scap07]